MKLQTVTDSYKELNSELLRDIPLLYADRCRFFAPAVATVMEAYTRYYETCHKSSKQLTPYYQNIDRSAIHRHPNVITDKEISAAYKPSGVSGTEEKVSSTSQTQTQTPTVVVAQGPPPAQYNTPTPGYQSPPPQYNQPVQQYNQPVQQYNPPAYNPPAQQTSPQIQNNRNTTPVITSPQNPAPKPRPSTAGSRALPIPGNAGAKPASSVIKAKALYQFNAESPAEISFKVGDIIIIHKQDGEWWEGELKGRRGYLPANYVQLIS